MAAGEKARDLRAQPTEMSSSVFDPRGSMGVLKGMTLEDIAEGQHGCAGTGILLARNIEG